MLDFARFLTVVVSVSSLVAGTLQQPANAAQEVVAASSSVPVPAALKPSKLETWRSKTSYRVGETPAKIRIVATAAGRAGTGSVSVRVAQRSHTVRLARGRAAFVLPQRLPVGWYRIVLRYRPSSGHARSTRVTYVKVQDLAANPRMARTPRLSSARNFRDVAGPGTRGYRTSSGRYMVKGLVFRANVLSLSAGDVAKLRNLDVKRVYDLRRGDEIAKTPDSSIPRAGRTNVNILGRKKPPNLLAVNRTFVSDARARAQFGRLLRAIGRTDAPQLFHCQAGKDRTGWAAALLQSIAGVPRTTIMKDYLASNAYLNKPGGNHVYVEAAFINAGFDEVSRTYGSMDNYLTRGLGLSRSEINTIREKLIV